VKKTAILFSLTKNLAFAAGSVMQDIERFSPGLADDTIVLHNGLSAGDMQAINKIRKTRFIKYSFPILDTSRFNKTVTEYFTTMVFSKFEAFRLLEEYKSIIVLDYDLIIQGELSELKAFPPSGMLTVDKTAIRSQFFCGDIQEYDLNKESRVGSVWALWDNLPNYKEIYLWCYKEAERLAPSLYLPETGIISLALEVFGISPDQSLKSEEFDCHPSANCAHRARIMHCYGQPKYWNGYYSEQWEGNYKRWLALGGSPCRDRNAILKMIAKLKRLPSFARALFRISGR
jgi:hypothetical protein